MLLEEFEAVSAVIEPTDPAISIAGECCDTMIATFNGEVIERIKQLPNVRQAGSLSNLNGELPWYIYEADGYRVGVALLVIGAPMAVALLEEWRAVGFKRFIVFGTCGVLDASLAADKIILPTSALRDEGMSYHYAPASDEIAYAAADTQRLAQILDRQGIEYTRTKTWTIDAFYRETPDKVKRRLAAGAQVVEMEAASIMAWSQFRTASVYQFFYTADYVNHMDQQWEKRAEERTADCMTFFNIALSIAKELEKVE